MGVYYIQKYEENKKNYTIKFYFTSTKKVQE